MAIKTSTPPDGHQHMQLSKIKLPDDFSHPMVEWLKKPKDILLYVGRAGCGKTYFCMAVINFLKELGLPQIYVHEQEFLSHFKDCVTQGRSYEHDLEVYIEQPFLIYDDMGFGKITEWQQEIMYKLIDGRVKNRLPTIITSNFILEDIKKVYGERIHSRLAAIRNVKIESGEQDLRQVYK